MFYCPFCFDEEYMRGPSYRITINTNNHTLTLLKNGKIFRTYKVAVGKPTAIESIYNP